MFKLKELYFNRKVKPMKGKYMNKLKGVLPKKRYIIGLKEVTKNLSMQRLTMVILSTNIENVEGEFGLD